MICRDLAVFPVMGVAGPPRGWGETGKMSLLNSLDGWDGRGRGLCCVLRGVVGQEECPRENVKVCALT